MRMAVAGIVVAGMVLAGGTAEAQGPAHAEEDVTFQNGDVKLAGTLTLPAGKGPHPAVILISGSGPQNRDSLLFGFPSFQVLAHALAADGIAVLRYDDRGVGGSTGNIGQSTTADFSADALAGLQMLAGRADIRKERRGIIGHSEGALAAAIAAAGSRDVAFVVLLAGSAVPGADVLRQQAGDLAKAGGASDAMVATILAEHRKLTDALHGSADEAALAAAMTSLARAQIAGMPESQRAMIPDVDAAIATAIKPQIAAMRSPWMRYFIDFDPATALAKVTCPVLAVYGDKDLQVPPSVNRAPLEAALARAGNRAVTVKVYPTANHLFREATTGHPSEYATLPKAFVTPLLADVSAWILAQGR